MPTTSEQVAVGLARSCHPVPAGAVTALTALLAVADGRGLGPSLLVTSAVATGQLTIGWSNDLLDAERDRIVGRTDKPVAREEVPRQAVVAALALAAACCVGLSLACGLAAGVVHLALVVGAGWAYNLGLKRTAWSWSAYAVAFGALPAVVTLTRPSPHLPGAWVVLAGALLGVGAHLLNALPDLAGDAATGVRGWPQRLGARRVRWVAPVVLTAASGVAAVGAGGGVVAGALFAACLALAGVAVAGRGRVPFGAAVAIAVIDAVSLVLHG